MSTRPGVADPTAVRLHREVPGTAGHFGTGSALANATPVSVDISTAGASEVTVWLKATVGGTLSAAALRPDKSSTYAYNKPTDVPVTANTEAVIQFTSLHGEHAVRVTFTPSAGPGTVTFLDTAQFP
jgi:hypothetical protein